jgi:hypothetical protein
MKYVRFLRSILGLKKRVLLHTGRYKKVMSEDRSQRMP